MDIRLIDWRRAQRAPKRVGAPCSRPRTAGPSTGCCAWRSRPRGTARRGTTRTSSRRPPHPSRASRCTRRRRRCARGSGGRRVPAVWAFILSAVGACLLGSAACMSRILRVFISRKSGICISCIRRVHSSYRVFVAQVVGLIMLPFDGNGARAMGMIAHPGDVSGIAVSYGAHFP